MKAEVKAEAEKQINPFALPLLNLDLNLNLFYLLFMMGGAVSSMLNTL